MRGSRSATGDRRGTTTVPGPGETTTAVGVNGDSAECGDAAAVHLAAAGELSRAVGESTSRPRVAALACASVSTSTKPLCSRVDVRAAATTAAARAAAAVAASPPSGRITSTTELGSRVDVRWPSADDVEPPPPPKSIGGAGGGTAAGYLHGERDGEKKRVGLLPPPPPPPPRRRHGECGLSGPLTG